MEVVWSDTWLEPSRDPNGRTVAQAAARNTGRLRIKWFYLQQQAQISESLLIRQTGEFTALSSPGRPK